ncbi:hypothetical protein CULT_1470015 [[Clostridium] ultunense Esp]|nr:hypothetical protein CULT_1470015 [[Clostridium] ultunense Esp]
MNTFSDAVEWTIFGLSRYGVAIYSGMLLRIELRKYSTITID